MRKVLWFSSPVTFFLALLFYGLYRTIDVAIGDYFVQRREAEAFATIQTKAHLGMAAAFFAGVFVVSAIWYATLHESKVEPPSSNGSA